MVYVDKSFGHVEVFNLDTSDLCLYQKARAYYLEMPQSQISLLHREEETQNRYCHNEMSRGM